MTANSKFQGAGRCVEAANMSVTVAVEEARKRGYLSQRDCERLSKQETDQYIDLSRREFGVSEWQDARVGE